MKAAVTGTIKTAQGDPLSGATIRVKGTDVSTLTANKGDVLLISYVGFSRKEYTVHDASNILLVLDRSLDSTHYFVISTFMSSEPAFLYRLPR